VPVHFVTGHTHRREYTSLDEYSSSFEAGRYLDTVGFLSYQSLRHIDAKKAALDIAQSLNVTREEESEASTAHHVFSDGTVPALESALNIPEASLRTPDGEDLAKFIKQIQIERGLEHVIGWECETYLLNKSISSHDSMWGHFQREVVPSRFQEDHMIVLGNPAWRTDAIFKGEIRLDDAIAVSPFNNSLLMYENVPSSVVQLLNKNLNENKTDYTALPDVPLYAFAPAASRQRDTYHSVLDSFAASIIETALE